MQFAQKFFKNQPVWLVGKLTWDSHYFRHTYCGDCIVSWAAQGTTCPECRTEIKPELIGRDIIADKIILDLEVSCVNKLCPWKGKLEILEKHVKYCPYEKTPDWLSKLKSAFKIEDEEKSNHQLEDVHLQDFL